MRIDLRAGKGQWMDSKSASQQLGGVKPNENWWTIHQSQLGRWIRLDLVQGSAEKKVSHIPVQFGFLIARSLESVGLVFGLGTVKGSKVSNPV